MGPIAFPISLRRAPLARMMQFRCALMKRLALTTLAASEKEGDVVYDGSAVDAAEVAAAPLRDADASRCDSCVGGPPPRFAEGAPLGYVGLMAAAALVCDFGLPLRWGLAAAVGSRRGRPNSVAAASFSQPRCTCRCAK